MKLHLFTGITFIYFYSGSQTGVLAL